MVHKSTVIFFTANDTVQFLNLPISKKNVPFNFKGIYQLLNYNDTVNLLGEDI